MCIPQIPIDSPLLFFPACVHAMDIGIILDSSRTVGWNNFETLKRTLAKFTDYFHVSEEGTHFGFIHYKEDAMLDFDFADSSLYNPKALKEKILEIKYDPGLRRTDRAIEMANERLFTGRGGARKDVQKFLIVITNGKSSEGSSPYPSLLAPLKVILLTGQLLLVKQDVRCLTMF